VNAFLPFPKENAMRPIRLAVLLAAAVLLASCSASTAGDSGADTAGASPPAETAAEEPTGTVEVAYTIPGLVQAPLEEAAAAYNDRETGVTVELVQTGQTCVDQPQRLQGDAVAGELPSIAMLCLNAIRPFVDAGLAQSIEPLIAEDPDLRLEDFAPPGLDALRFDGELYGFPVGLSVPIMYYNADQFREAGLDPDDPPATFDEVAEAAAAVGDPAANRAGMLWTQFPDNWNFAAALQSAGGALANDDETAPTFNSPEGVAILEAWRALVEAGLMPVQTDGPAAADAFVRGDTAMLIHTNGQASNIEKGADFEVRTAPMPVPEDEAQRSLSMQGLAYVMFAEDEQEQRAALAVMKELVSPDNVGGFARATGFVPSIPALVDTELKQFYDENPNQETAARLIEDSVPVYNWPGTRKAEIAAILNEQIVLALNGEVSAEQALDTAAEQIEPLMRQ
jgi:multiple sugar transport system substrate-binding protein